MFANRAVFTGWKTKCGKVKQKMKTIKVDGDTTPSVGDEINPPEAFDNPEA